MMHYFEGRNGHRLAADIFGEGPPVFMLHGGGQTRYSWSETGQFLASRGYQAIALDARGHGDSDWSREGYAMNVLADDLSCVIEKVGGEPVLLGASLGGLTSLFMMGTERPPQISGLVLIDITPKINSAGTAEIRNFMRAHLGGFANLDEAAEAIAAYNPHRPRPKNLNGLKRNLREREGRWYWHWDPAFVTPPENSTISTLEDDIHAAARKISKPALLVYGSNSRVVEPDQIEALSNAIPQVEVIRVSGAGHMVVGDANTEFGYAVTGFLEKHYALATT